MSLTTSIVGYGAIGSLLIARCLELKIPFNVLARESQRITMTLELCNKMAYKADIHTHCINTSTIEDVVIIPVKAYQVKDVLDQLNNQLRHNTCIVLLHNGMGSIEIIKDRFVNQPTILATTSHGAFKPSKNHAIQTGIGQSQFGWLQKGKLCLSKQHALEQLIEKLLTPATQLEDMQTAIWKKLAVNASINPMTAALNLKNGQLNEKHLLSTIDVICQEISKVAKLHHISLSASELFQNTCRVIEDTSENYSSMFQDIQASQKTEIDNINGYIVASAEKFNLPVPETKRWLDKIKSLEMQYPK